MLAGLTVAFVDAYTEPRPHGSPRLHRRRSHPRRRGAAHARIRRDVPFMPTDRPIAPDIARVRALLDDGSLLGAVAEAIGPLE